MTSSHKQNNTNITRRTLFRAVADRIGRSDDDTMNLVELKFRAVLIKLFGSSCEINTRLAQVT